MPFTTLCYPNFTKFWLSRPCLDIADQVGTLVPSYHLVPGLLPGPTRINLDSPESYQLPTKTQFWRYQLCLRCHFRNLDNALLRSRQEERPGHRAICRVGRAHRARAVVTEADAADMVVLGFPTWQSASSSDPVALLGTRPNYSRREVTLVTTNPQPNRRDRRHL